MANLKKLFVLVASGNTTWTSGVTTEAANKQKIYFNEKTHQIWVNGVAYGIDPDSLKQIGLNKESLDKLIALYGESAKTEDEKTIIERIKNLEEHRDVEDIQVNGESVLTYDAATSSYTANLITKGVYNSETNPFATQKDVTEILSVLHFRGNVEPESVTDPKDGDVVISPSTKKEYIYYKEDWHEIDDEGAYVKKTETIAGIDLSDDITSTELTAALLSATTTAQGLMSADDKKKLDGIESGAQVNILEVIKVDGESASTAVAYVAANKEVDITLDGKVDKVEGSGLTQNNLTNDLKAAYDLAVASAHSHENKTVLDAITSADTAEWDGALAKAEAYTDEQIDLLDSALTASSVTTYDSTTYNYVAVSLKQEDGLLTETTIDFEPWAEYEDEQANNTILYTSI